jgi:hypothetical protein
MINKDETRYRRQLQACLRSFRSALAFERITDDDHFRDLRTQCVQLIQLCPTIDDGSNDVAAALESIRSEMMGSREKKAIESGLQQLRFALSDLFDELDRLGKETFPKSRDEIIGTFPGM